MIKETALSEKNDQLRIQSLNPRSNEAERNDALLNAREIYLIKRMKVHDNTHNNPSKLLSLRP